MGGAHQEGFGFFLISFREGTPFFLLHIYLSVLWASLNFFLSPAEILGGFGCWWGLFMFPSDALWPLAFFWSSSCLMRIF